MAGLSGLVTAALTTDYGRVARQAQRNLILGAMVGLLLLTAYMGGVGALAFYLSTVAGPAVALLVIALGALAFALVLLAAILVSNRREREIQRRRAQAARSSALVNVGLSALPILLRARPLPSLVIAAVAAFAVGMMTFEPTRKE